MSKNTKKYFDEQIFDYEQLNAWINDFIYAYPRESSWVNIRLIMERIVNIFASKLSISFSRRADMYKKIELIFKASKNRLSIYYDENELNDGLYEFLSLWRPMQNLLHDNYSDKRDPIIDKRFLNDEGFAIKKISDLINFIHKYYFSIWYSKPWEEYVVLELNNNSTSVGTNITSEDLIAQNNTVLKLMHEKTSSPINEKVFSYILHGPDKFFTKQHYDMWRNNIKTDIPERAINIYKDRVAIMDWIMKVVDAEWMGKKSLYEWANQPKRLSPFFKNNAYTRYSELSGERFVFIFLNGNSFAEGKHNNFTFTQPWIQKNINWNMFSLWMNGVDSVNVVWVNKENNEYVLKHKFSLEKYNDRFNFFIERIVKFFGGQND